MMFAMNYLSTLELDYVQVVIQNGFKFTEMIHSLLKLFLMLENMHQEDVNCL